MTVVLQVAAIAGALRGVAVNVITVCVPAGVPGAYRLFLNLLALRAR